MKLIYSVLGVGVLLSAGLAFSQEMVTGKVCASAQVSGFGETPRWVVENRQFFTKAEKLIHNFEPNCLFFKIHPAKVELTTEFFLADSVGELNDQAVLAYQEKLQAFKQTKVMVLDHSHGLPDADRLIRSLYPDAQVTKTEQGVEVTASGQTLSSISALFNVQ